MKRILFFALILLLSTILAYLLINRKNINPAKKTAISPPALVTKKSTNKTIQSATSIFIPYWAVDGEMNDLEKYDRLFYFGVAANLSGISKNEAGFLKLEKFLQNIPNGKVKFLTLRMLDADLNLSILSDEKIRGKIIQDTIDIAKQYQFEGVVLDLEISSIFNTDLSNQITEFVQQFYTAVKIENLKLLITLYGDTIYRKRPYDVAKIAENSDEILLMAYDFHKAKGEPGPNFPLSGRDKYGYDFMRMIEEYLRFTDPNKLSAIFGMYGYDWMVDEKKRPIKPAKALSLNEIRQKFMAENVTTFTRSYKSGNDDQGIKCGFENCLLKRDELSKETEINYVVVDSARSTKDLVWTDYHIVWFEDEESVKAKVDYLEKKGIGNIGYWAWGYF